MTDLAILGKKVLKKYPFMAKELITIPDISDLDLIPSLYTEYCEIQANPITKAEITHQRLIFIAAIVKLYDPDFFEGFKKNMKNGLRQKLSETLCCKPSTVSNSWKTVTNYLSIYPDFNNELAYIYSELKKYAANGQKITNSSTI